jgi:predicted RNA-binding Zn ribbon-like protein
MCCILYHGHSPRRYILIALYIKLPEAMERVFRAAIGAKAVASDAEPKLYSDAMRCPDPKLWHQAMVRKM